MPRHTIGTPCASALSGRAWRALEAALQAEKEDPQSLIVLVNAAGFLIGAGRTGEAEERLVKAARIDPTNPVVWGHQAYFAAVKKDYGLAVELERKVAASRPEDVGAKADLAYMLSLKGEMEEVRGILEEIKALADSVWEKPALLAYVYYALGDMDKTFENANHAVRRKCLSFSSIRYDPFFQKMRDDPRWGSLLAAAGLPA